MKRSSTQSGAASPQSVKFQELSWTGFPGITLCHAGREQIEAAFGSARTVPWQEWRGSCAGEILRYGHLGLLFKLGDSVLQSIEVTKPWQGRTTEQISIGSAATDLEAAAETLRITEGHTQISSEDLLAGYEGLVFGRILQAPGGKEMCASMSFYFEANLPFGNDSPPWPATRIKKIELWHNPDFLLKCKLATVMLERGQASVLCRPEPKAPEAPQAWHKFKQYVSIPDGVPESKVQTNMRFQFMFTSQVQANNILGSLPPAYTAALRAANCWFQGINPEGKFQIAWDRVRLSIADGKAMMNIVVSSGGEIYEAFLT